MLKLYKIIVATGGMDKYLPEWKIRYATRLYSKVAQVPPTEDHYPPANIYYLP
jgi:hypothetical protein